MPILDQNVSPAQAGGEIKWMGFKPVGILFFVFGVAFILRIVSFSDYLRGYHLAEFAYALFLFFLAFYGWQNLHVDLKWWGKALSSLSSIRDEIDKSKDAETWGRVEAWSLVNQNAIRGSFHWQLQMLVKLAATRRDAGLVRMMGLQTGARDATEVHHFVARTLLIFGLAGTMAGLGTMPLGAIADAVDKRNNPARSVAVANATAENNDSAFSVAVAGATGTIVAAVVPSILATLLTVGFSYLRHFKLAKIQNDCQTQFKEVIIEHLLPAITGDARFEESMSQAMELVEKAAAGISAASEKISQTMGKMEGLVGAFPEALKGATEALTQAAEKMTTAGQGVSDNLAAGGARAKETLEEGAGRAAGSLVTGGQSAGEAMSAGGGSAADSMINGGNSAGAAMSAGGSSAAGSMVAGGNSAGESMSGGGVNAATAMAEGGQSAGGAMETGGEKAKVSLVDGATLVEKSAEKIKAGLDENVKALEASKDHFTSAALEAGAALKEGGKTAGESLTQGAQGAEDKISKAKEAVKEVGVLVREGLELGANTAADILKEGGKVAAGALTQGAQEAGEKISKAKEAVKEVGDLVREGLAQGANTAADILKEGGKIAGDSLTQGGKSVKADMSEIGQTMKDAGVAAGDGIKEGAKSAAEVLVTSGENAGGAMVQGGTRARDAMAEGGTNAGNAMTQGGTSAGNAMTQGGTSAESAMAEGGTNAKASLEGGGNLVSKAGEKVQTDLEGAVKDFSEGAKLLKDNLDPSGQLLNTLDTAFNDAASLKADLKELRGDLAAWHQQNMEAKKASAKSAKIPPSNGGKTSVKMDESSEGGEPDPEPTGSPRSWWQRINEGVRNLLKGDRN